MDELIHNNDIREIKLISERINQLLNKILALNSQIQELKISEGETSRDAMRNNGKRI